MEVSETTTGRAAALGYKDNHSGKMEKDEAEKTMAAGAVGKRSDVPPSARQFLPTSAPVSSLLPHISSHTLPTLQSQILALLNPDSVASSSAASLALNPQAGAPGLTLSNDSPMVRFLATQSAAMNRGSISMPVVVPNMQGWTLEQIEKHAQLHQQLGQPIPPELSLLLTQTRKREEKKHAKRLANRKSASTSRARKKALVTEMTELNAKLKRQALILSLLPDLVIVIDTEGIITFCSAQVERILLHKSDDLVGAKLTELLVPTSRPKLQNLIRELLSAEAKTLTKDSIDQRTEQRPFEVDDVEDGNEYKKPRVAKSDNGSSVRGDAATDAAMVSEPSFPMSVVNLGVADVQVPSEENVNSDLSASNIVGPKPVSSIIADKGSLQRSPTASSLGNSGSNCGSGSDDMPGKSIKADERKKARKEKSMPSSDTSNSSSLSAAAKQLQKANVNLERNVRWHNRKLKDAAKKRGLGYKDDVIGDDVTANNATARLSSLRLRMESSSEEDSGYRESNDSREETSSSSSFFSDSNGRLKPLAPTCNVCLIRDNLTTIWCEVTSSIRSAGPDLEVASTIDDETKSRKNVSGKSSSGSDMGDPPIDLQDIEEPQKELLLCLRPIRDGEKKVDDKLRFIPERRKVVSDFASSAEDSAQDFSGAMDSSSEPPTKKVRLEQVSGTRSEESSNSDSHNDAVESLMLMSNKKN